MKKCLIGIPVGATSVSGKLAPPRWTTNAGTPLALIQLGALPIIIPPLDDPEQVRLYYDMVDGLLISGGADIDPALYGQLRHEKCGETCANRDVLERRVLQWALEDRKPVLGICRGCQMINVTCGGTLYQDVPSQHANPAQHLVAGEVEDWYVKPHKIEVRTGTKLAEIMGGGEFEVNSVHHQAVRELGKGLLASATSPDGLIEAIEHEERDRFLVGIQCHPEVLWKEDEHWRKLFLAFIQECERFPLRQTPSWVI